jgi:rhamnosyltransferase
LLRLLPRLGAQRIDGGFELIAIDSSSSDRSVELLEQAGAHVERIAQSEFGHGKTRNALARLSRGEFLVFLSQDALPEGERFLAELTRAFEDELTAGSAARILPHEDDDPLTARTALALPDASDRARVFQGNSQDVIFNDVASSMRRAAWMRVPFPELPFGEDLAWARAALAEGWRLRFSPQALVRHAHRYSPRQAFERYKVDAAFQREFSGRSVRPSALSVLKGVAYELREDWRHVKRRGGPFSSLWRAPLLRSAQVLGQYVGARSSSGLPR